MIYITIYSRLNFFYMFTNNSFMHVLSITFYRTTNYIQNIKYVALWALKSFFIKGDYQRLLFTL